MKFLEDQKLNGIIELIESHITPEVRTNLIDLKQKFDEWFIWEPKTNIQRLNYIVDKELYKIQGVEHFEYINNREDLQEQGKIRLKYILNHYLAEYNFLKSFMGFTVLNRCLANELSTVDFNFNCVDLVQCEDIREFIYSKYGKQNISSKDLEKSQKYMDCLDLICNSGFDRASYIMNCYRMNKKLSTVHNLLF